jgi:hypothetical protein
MGVVNMSNSDDLSLAMWLLCGIRPSTAVQLAPVIVVPTYQPDYPEGNDEKKAREAIVRLLKTDSAERVVLIDTLAALFDPETNHPFVTKKFVLAHRKEGAPAKARRNAAICMAIEGLHEFMGLSYESAYERIADKHGLSIQTIKDIFLNWRKGGGTVKFPR